MINRRTLLQSASAFAASSAISMPATLRAQEGPIKIGIMFPQSGPQEQPGTGYTTGALIAVEQINKAGGLLGRKLEPHVRDDKGTGAGAIAAYRELVDLGINLLVGAMQSPMGLALAPLLKEHNAVLVGTATAMSLTREGFTRNFFRINPDAHMFYGGLGQIMGQRFRNVAKWSSIVFDSASGRDAIAAFQGGLRATSKANLEFAPTIFAAQTAADFKVEISNIMASGSEGLYLGLIGGPAISFLQQARSVGLTSKLKAIGEGGTDVSIGRALQRQTPETIWGRGYWYPDNELFRARPLSQQLYADYVAKTGDKFPLGFPQLGHKLVLAITEGVRKAGTTKTDAVIAAMEGLQFDSAEGPVFIRAEDHQAIGYGHYANQKPLNVEPFHGVGDVVGISDSATVLPPTPGVAYVPK
jgi:branched-chain amino acid transport system substrate-binding protein